MSQRHHFEVGDRVEYVGDMTWELRGKTGEITRAYNQSDIFVNWDGSDHGHSVVAESLKFIEPKVEYEPIVEEAKRLVYGNRNVDYGHPYDDYERTAKLWGAILGVEITPQQAILCMIAVKLSRLTNDHTKRDSIVDVAGYAECLMRVNRREEGLE